MLEKYRENASTRFGFSRDTEGVKFAALELSRGSKVNLFGHLHLKSLVFIVRIHTTVHV